MKRRHFIRNSVLSSFLALYPFPYHRYAGSGRKYISDRVSLGNTGIEVSRMAVGTGTNGWAKRSNQTRQLGIKGLADLLVAGYDHGVLFWDSADQYGTYPHLKEALKRVPRENVVILTKTHATSEKEMKEDIDRFRRELGTDYIDVMLLHMMMDENWPEIKAGAMNVLSRAREEGIVRSHGVSCHSLRALKTAVKTDWVQVDLARINLAGAIMDATVPLVVDVLKQMKDSGKSVIGMKILGAGKLSDRIDESLQFILAQNYVDCFTIGIENYGQFRDLEKRLPEASVRG
ncbi:MAG: aldo/keto reductase [Bacteroidales bacterium]|jgi:aryl-alcohol dehydrogenase-like predicted oxidoreductase